MKTILSTILSAAFAGATFAQVPSLINYQGRLTDANGDPVTGSKNFSISIYDAATGGNLLYTETIGAVTLDANGIYSFQFGGTGTSNTQVTETVASTDGTATTFQKVLANSPVVTGSVSVSDGTYTWSQSAGSSNEDDFGVAFSTSLRRVTVNYYSGAPAAGTTITATYRYGTSGITGALSTGVEHWMAVSVDGTAQATRQKVLAVPFALQANVATSVKSVADSALLVGTKTLEARLDSLLQLEASRLITGSGPALVANAKVERFGSANPNGQYGTFISTNSSLGPKGIDLNKKVILGTTSSPSITFQCNDLVKFAHLYHPGIGARTITTTFQYDDGTNHINTEERWINEGAGQFRTSNPFPTKVVNQITFSGINYNTAEMHYRSLSQISADLNMQSPATGESRLSVIPYVGLSEGYSATYEAYQADGSLVYSGSQSSFDVPQGRVVTRVKLLITPSAATSLLEGGYLQGVYFYIY